MSKSKVDAYAETRSRKPQKEFVDLSALLWGALRRRAWQSAGEVLRAIGAVFDQMPIDFMKGSVEVTRRRFSADRICKFLRQVQTIQDKNPNENEFIQTKFYRAYIVAEVAFHLCRMGYLSQAYKNMKAVAANEKFASMALFHSYSGILGLELVNGAADPDSPENRTILADSIEALRKGLELEPHADVVLLCLTKAAERYADLGIDVYDELVRFRTQNPNSPYACQLLFDYLKRHRRYDELFNAGFETLMLDPASSIFHDLIGLADKNLIDSERMSNLCIHRLQYTLYDLPAWRTLAGLLPDLGDAIIPDAWWLDMHFRHTRAMVRELGLPFDEPNYIGDRLPVLPQDESYEPLEALVYKTICAAYLLDEGPDSRFVVETVRALLEGEQMTRLDRIRDGIAQASKKPKKRRTSSDL